MTLHIRFIYIRRLSWLRTGLVWLRDSVIITNNVKETNTIRKKFRAGVEQVVPTDAGEEIQERRAIPEKADAGEILRAWDIKVRLNGDRLEKLSGVV